MTAGELEHGAAWFADRFYSLPSIFYRLLVKSGVGLWWNISRNLGYRLALTQRAEVDFDAPGAGFFPTKDWSA